MVQFKVVIGLEIHVCLQTVSKLFSGASNDDQGVAVNTNITPYCIGHPGTLPVLNKEAVTYAVQAALGLNMKVNLFSKFDRKHYFYPDLPKGYQISQYDQPVAENGSLEIKVAGQTKEILIERLHLEEDAAKLVHLNNCSAVDYNRAGSPLIEIVTKPVLETPAEAGEFLRELRLLIKSLGVSEADMEKGQLRCDANISLVPEADYWQTEAAAKVSLKPVTGLFPKTEIKNLNSFKAVEKALTYEIKRQQDLWLEGNPPVTSSTRGFDPLKNITLAQREKEAEADYRYFPDPDLPPVVLTAEEVLDFKRHLPETPQLKRARFQNEYYFSYHDSKLLTSDLHLSYYTEKLVAEVKAWFETSDDKLDSAELSASVAKLMANWLLNNVLGLLKNSDLTWQTLSKKVTPENLAELLKMVSLKEVTKQQAKEILEIMFTTGSDPSHLKAEKFGNDLESNDLQLIIDEVIAQNPNLVTLIKSGKTGAINSLVGQVMKKTKGQANPVVVKDLLAAGLEQ